MAKKLTDTIETSIAIPSIYFVASEKSAGKTHFTVFLGDFLTANNVDVAFMQVDDQNRLQQMLGVSVTALMADPELLIEDPTLAMRALIPLYEEASVAVVNGRIPIIDIGAKQTSTVAQFLATCGFGADCAIWKLRIIVFVPYLPSDPESNEQAEHTIALLRRAMPDARFVLIENRYGGSRERIVRGSLAERAHQKLIETAGSCDHIFMPNILKDYWAPFEGAGIRFLRALSMDPQEGSHLLGVPVPYFKIMQSAIVKFWRPMAEQLQPIVFSSREEK